MYKSAAVVALAASLVAAQAQTPAMTAAPLPTAITPEQSSAILAGFSSYNSYLENNQYVHSLGAAINTWLPIGSWDNWNAQGFASAPKTTDYLALATALPTYSYPAWATGLPGSLQSEWGAFATSVQVAHESIVRQALSIQDNTELPGPTAGTNLGPTPTSNNITKNTVQGHAPTKAPLGALAIGAVALAGLAL